MYEARWDTIEDRMADIFVVGYGQMWLPPPQRADTGNHSVGYDVFDRFDLGKPRDETLYGTETSLKTVISAGHDACVKMYTDFVPNHNGFRNSNTPGFATQGGYPGFVLSTTGDSLGDFHNPALSYEQDAINGSLFGLIDIAQEKNHQFIRHPVSVGNPDNIPAGTIYNNPDANNAQYYPDQDLGGLAMNDPNTGGAFTRFNFNLADPLAGDPTQENATGLLMRNMQYMIQVIGVDGFRIDAARHIPTWAMNYLDNAVFRTNPRANHDGSIRPVYMFSEVADGFAPNVQPYIRRDLPNKYAISSDDTTVSGNRDAMDFPLFWAMVGNLTSNGTQNNWHNIRGASLDNHDRPSGPEIEVWHSDGSQGVTFVDSHDDQGGGQRPHLYKVAYAYTLMKPGNAIVYLNAKEFGEGRNFPYDVGGSSYSMSNDALGGYHGDDVAKLVDIRNTHGRGNFAERWIDDAFNPNGFSNIYIYERENSALVGLNNRLDSGYDQRSPVQTSFDAGTVLVELTSNAANTTVDPGGDIPEAIRVNGSGQVTMRVPRNSSHGLGYVIYGLATPEGTLSLSNVSQMLQGATPTQGNNGTARLADIDVITADSFAVQLNTTPVTLPAPFGESSPVRDEHADGDRAVVKVDDGIDLNGNAVVDNTIPGSVAYGFEEFVDVNTPGYIYDGGANIGTGSGTYEQTIDATQLSEGRHYITVRAFRHRDAATGGDGGPAVFSDFKRAVYIDRLPPESEVVSFEPFASSPGNPNNRDLILGSVDKTADNMHVLLDLPASLTDSQVMQMIGSGSSTSYYDRDERIRGYFDVETGNHVVTIVSFEPTGNSNVQRFAGVFTDTNIGLGFGDVTGDGFLRPDDIFGIGSFSQFLFSQDTEFHAAADSNGDGLIDNRDLFDLEEAILAGTNDPRVYNAYVDLLADRGDFDGNETTDPNDLALLYANMGGSDWLFDLNVDGTVDLDDAEVFVTGLLRTSPGDYNLNGVVDAADYTLWRGMGGTTFAADGDFDGDVDEDDYFLWRSNFGVAREPFVPLSGIGAGGVPEPTTFLHVVCAAVAWLVTARRINHRRRENLARREIRQLRIMVTEIGSESSATPPPRIVPGTSTLELCSLAAIGQGTARPALLRIDDQ